MYHETLYDRSFGAPSKTSFTMPNDSRRIMNMLNELCHSCCTDDDRIVKIEKAIRTRKNESYVFHSSIPSTISIVTATTVASSTNSCSSSVTCTIDTTTTCRRKEPIGGFNNKHNTENAMVTTKSKNRSSRKKIVDDKLMVNMKELMERHNGRKEEARFKIYVAIKQTCAKIVALEPKRDLNLERAKQTFYDDTFIKCNNSTEIAKRTIAAFCMEQYIHYDHIIQQYMEIIRNLKKVEYNMNSGRITTDEIDFQIESVLSIGHQSITATKTTKVSSSAVHQLSQETLLEKLHTLMMGK